jgi:hypothetical protein
MIILDATTRSLEVVLGGAITTNQLPIVSSYVDNTTTAYTPASSNTATNNTTAVTAVAAPGASTQRQVKLLTVNNADTASATVTVRYNDNSTTRVLFKAALAVGDNLIYTDGEGFRVVDSSGNTKQLYGGGLGVPAGGTGNTTLTSNAVLTGNGAGPINSTGVTIDPSTNAIYGYGAKLNAQTGTSYTLVATDIGKIVECSNAAAITVTLPNSLSQGFYCTVVQTGAGQVTLSAAGGATLNNYDTFAKTAGQYAALNLYVTTNGTGSTAVYIAQGRMTA